VNLRGAFSLILGTAGGGYPVVIVEKDGDEAFRLNVIMRRQSYWKGRSGHRHHVFRHLFYPNLVTFGGGGIWESFYTVVELVLVVMGANAAKDPSLSIGYTTTDFIHTCHIRGILRFGHYEIQGAAVKQ